MSILVKLNGSIFITNRLVIVEDLPDCRQWEFLSFMCRVFGFKSVIDSQVHNSLLNAENALLQQSKHHPHGWGVAYYIAGSPHIIKNVDSAVDDRLFQRVSGVVSSQTVIAHLRKATLGEHSIVNTHPFQFGPWVFAHNGHIHEFQKYRKSLIELVHPELEKFILGETDSELIFYIIMTEVMRSRSFHSPLNISELGQRVKSALDRVVDVIGPMSETDTENLECNYLSFVISNGKLLLGHNGGKNMFYSTYKTKCGDRETCSSFGQSCEAPTLSGKVKHLIFSSEPLSGENVWEPVRLRQMIGLDQDMTLWIEPK
ncbi:MAG: class II glutamine amidotransferase [Bdellovibrionales bacterium]